MLGYLAVHNIFFQNSEKKTSKIHFQVFILLHFIYWCLYFNYNTYIKEIYLHFSSTYIHQNLQFILNLYSEGFYRRFVHICYDFIIALYLLHL